MLVDTNAIRTLGAACSSQADDLSAALSALKSLDDPQAAGAMGPVGAAFLAALADATAVEARAITELSAKLASAQPVSGAVADSYAATDRHNSRLL